MNRTLKRGKKMAEEMTDISINEEVPTDTKKKKNTTNFRRLKLC